MNVELHPYTATVIAARQYFKAQMLVRTLARANGPYTEIDLDEALDLFQPWMHESIKTVVVYGFTDDQKWRHHLKSMISSPQMQVNRLMKPVMTMNTPNFIFCTGDVDALAMCEMERRFNVVKVD
jgi:hypothetical protein